MELTRFILYGKRELTSRLALRFGRYGRTDSSSTALATGDARAKFRLVLRGTQNLNAMFLALRRARLFDLANGTRETVVAFAYTVVARSLTAAILRTPFLFAIATLIPNVAIAFARDFIAVALSSTGAFFSIRIRRTRLQLGGRHLCRRK